MQTKKWRIWFAICNLCTVSSDHEKKLEFVLLKYFLANKCQTAKSFTRNRWNWKVPVKQEKKKMTQHFLLIFVIWLHSLMWCFYVSHTPFCIPINLLFENCSFKHTLLQSLTLLCKNFYCFDLLVNFLSKNIAKGTTEFVIYQMILYTLNIYILPSRRATR